VGPPGAISLAGLLQVDGLVPVGFSGQRLVQNHVNGIEELSSDLVETVLAPLGYLNEVINKDISGSQGLA
jgi:hypothetical protein